MNFPRQYIIHTQLLQNKYRASSTMQFVVISRAACVSLLNLPASLPNNFHFFNQFINLRRNNKLSSLNVNGLQRLLFKHIPLPRIFTFIIENNVWKICIYFEVSILFRILYFSPTLNKLLDVFLFINWSASFTFCFLS